MHKNINIRFIHLFGATIISGCLSGGGSQSGSCIQSTSSKTEFNSGVASVLFVKINQDNVVTNRCQSVVMSRENPENSVQIFVHSNCLDFNSDYTYGIEYPTSNTEVARILINSEMLRKVFLLSNALGEEMPTSVVDQFKNTKEAISYNSANTTQIQNERSLFGEQICSEAGKQKVLETSGRDLFCYDYYGMVSFTGALIFRDEAEMQEFNQVLKDPVEKEYAGDLSLWIEATAARGQVLVESYVNSVLKYYLEGCLKAKPGVQCKQDTLKKLTAIFEGTEIYNNNRLLKDSNGLVQLEKFGEVIQQVNLTSAEIWAKLTHESNGLFEASNIAFTKLESQGSPQIMDISLSEIPDLSELGLMLRDYGLINLSRTKFEGNYGISSLMLLNRIPVLADSSSSPMYFEVTLAREAPTVKSSLDEIKDGAEIANKETEQDSISPPPKNETKLPKKDKESKKDSVDPALANPCN